VTVARSDRIVIASRSARAASIVFLLLLAGAALGGIYDPVAGSAGGALWPGGLFVAAPVVLALRGLTVGVVVVGDTVISRGWWRTRTFRSADITSVRSANYSGLWNGSSSSRLFLMLELDVAGTEVGIPAVVGRPVKVQHLASQLSNALGLEKPRLRSLER
jgi:hypothetical protein